MSTSMPPLLTELTLNRSPRLYFLYRGWSEVGVWLTSSIQAAEPALVSTLKTFCLYKKKMFLSYNNRWLSKCVGCECWSDGLPVGSRVLMLSLLCFPADLKRSWWLICEPQYEKCVIHVYSKITVWSHSSNGNMKQGFDICLYHGGMRVEPMQLNVLTSDVPESDFI